MTSHAKAEPVGHKLLTPGVFVLLGVIAVGAAFAALRFWKGLGAATNLSDAYPWGIWIAFDVAGGVALAAGGFTTAALAYIFHRRHYHAIVRPALLTALLGYTFVAIGLLADLGRYYNIWHPMMPSMWSGHSVLFEVGMCVMCYLTVLYLEFAPIVAERFKGRVALPGALSKLNGTAEAGLRILDTAAGKLMPVLIIAGVVLSCMHQSSLGALMLLAPSKMHPLWYTPVLPLLFLMSAVAVGYPMVIVESVFASRAFKRKPEIHILSRLAKIVPFILFLYLAAKVSDLAIREAFPYLFEGGSRAALFWAEILLGVALPMVLFLQPAVRRSPNGLLAASLLVVGGVVLNRINVFLTAYTPVYETGRYFPSVGELAISAALVCTLILLYRAAVIVFPILPAEHAEAAEARG